MFVVPSGSLHYPLPISANRPSTPNYASQYAHKVKSPHRDVVHFSGHQEEQLLAAAESGSLESFSKALAQEKLNLNWQDDRGNTALMQAVGNADKVKALLDKRADPTIASHFGNTALMKAAQVGNMASVKLLVVALKSKHNDFTQVLNKEYNTALHLAASRGHTDVAKYLVEEGFSPTQLNLDKDTPIALAKENEHPETASALKALALQHPGNPETDNHVKSLFRDVFSSEKTRVTITPSSQNMEQQSSTQQLEETLANHHPEWTDSAYPLSEAATVLKLMRQGKPLTAYQGKYSLEDLLSPKSVMHVALALKTEAEKSEKRKKIVTARLIAQYENSEGEVQDYWNKVSQEAFKVPITLLATPHLRGLKAISGMDDLKEELHIDFVNPFLYGLHPERFLKEDGTPANNNPTPAYGLLLTGLPGTGKTYIAERLAEELDMPAFKLSPAMISSALIGESSKAAEEVFNKAKAVEGGSIIIADEVDSYLPDRSKFKGEQAAQVADINQFLLELQEAAKHGVFFIATTNHPEKLDAAAIREGRIDVKKDVSPPDFQARKELFRRYLKARRSDGSLPCTEEDLDYFAARTRAYSCAAIQNIANDASRLALAKKADLEAPFVDLAINRSKPSYSEKDMKPYRHID
jgi:hypothetical protein